MTTDIQSIILQRPEVGSGAVRVAVFADDMIEGVSYIIDDVYGECRMYDCSEWATYITADEGLPVDELYRMVSEHFADPTVSALSITEGCSVWQAICQAAERLCDKIFADEKEADD